MSPAAKGLPAAGPEARRTNAALPDGAEFEQPDNLANRVFGRYPCQLPFGPLLAVVIREQVQLERFRVVFLVLHPQGASIVCRSVRSLEADIRQQEGIVPPERGVHGAHQGGVGSVVDR